MNPIKLQKESYVYDNPRKGYWFRASSEHIYIVEYEIELCSQDNKAKNISAIVYEVNIYDIDDNISIEEIQNGQCVEYYDLFSNTFDWIIKMDIWGKYFFPKFNEEKNQWYHQIGVRDYSYIDDFCFILKESYNKALEISKLELN